MADYTQQALQGTPLPSEFNRDYRELLNAYIKLWQDGKISLDLLHKRVMELADESNKLANQALDNSGTAIETSESAEATANWILSQFNSIVGKATDGPASLQLKFGGYTGTEYESPQERMQKELVQRGKPPASGDLNDYQDLNTFFTFDTGKGAMKNTPLGNLAQGSAQVFLVQNFGFSNVRIEQRFTVIYTHSQWAEYRRIKTENTWGEWYQIATTNKAQMHKVTSDNGQAMSVSYQDLNKIVLTGNYRGVDMVNAPSKGWYFVEILNQGTSECLQIATNFGTKRRYIRYSDSVGTFNAWEEIAYVKTIQQMLDDQVKAYGLGSNPTNTLSAGTDLNTKTDSGFYRLNGDSFVNQPASVGYSQMLVIRGGGDTVTQVIFKYNEQIIWVRSGNPLNASGGKWFPWYKIASLDEVTNYGLGVAAASGVDWNTLTKSGFYAGSTNGPTSSVYIGIHVQHGSAYAYQIAGRNGAHYFRTNENGTWSAWQSIGKDLSPQGLGVAATTTVTDLNELTLSGWYTFNSSTANAPSIVGGGIVEHIPYSNNAYAIQTARLVNKRVQWMRIKNNGVWGDWLQTAGSVVDALWENLTPRGGSSAYDTANPPQVLRLGDMVYLRGALKGITGRQFIALTLPGHCRPSKLYADQSNISIGANYVARFARWSIATNGDVTMEYTSDNSFDAAWWSLDGISFPITA
ncbi:hypothetical protein CHH91_04650 [Virgibacillus sp. 7505]|uniref:pyocin knob domain-containing protein n=1 Tax=Virgibacillus sp. 7505 TaxID=2022548 RepID=UPI000BA75B19|nr:pyocin knob domain-containing protein [Virgibacillus sp. 7505]PAE17299.1 hypothetical protein CHH91_04650 [Virgibacillus sp. 7505]